MRKYTVGFLVFWDSSSNIYQMRTKKITSRISCEINKVGVNKSGDVYHVILRGLSYTLAWEDAKKLFIAYDKTLLELINKASPFSFLQCHTLMREYLPSKTPLPNWDQWYIREDPTTDPDWGIDLFNPYCIWKKYVESMRASRTKWGLRNLRYQDMRESSCYEPTI